MRTFVPAYRNDYGQSRHYIHTHTTANDDGGGIVAHFADGCSRPSHYATVAEMLAAGERDWRERLIEISLKLFVPFP